MVVRMMSFLVVLLMLLTWNVGAAAAKSLSCFVIRVGGERKKKNKKKQKQNFILGKEKENCRWDTVVCVQLVGRIFKYASVSMFLFKNKSTVYPLSTSCCCVVVGSLLCVMLEGEREEFYFVINFIYLFWYLINLL